MAAEPGGRDRARAIESWIARVRLAAVVFAVLEVDSAPDRGSVFRLVLPLTPD